MNRHNGTSVSTGLRLAVSAFLLAALSQAQNVRLVSLTGTYDLDQDGLSEFLALEKTQDDQREPHKAVYYEIESNGEHVGLWEFPSTRPLRDARIADTDGDGRPEVVIMQIPPPGPVSDGGAWLLVLPWEEGRFSSDPVYRWGKDSPGEGLALRPSHFCVLDVQTDGKDEIAVSLASPRREIVVLDRSGPTENPGPGARVLPLSEEIASGYGHIVLVAGDQNQDGNTDLLVLNKEFNRLKTQLFEGTGSDLVPGQVYDQSTETLGPSFTDILPSGLHQVDTDRDGDQELLVPFRTGPALTVSFQEGTLQLIPAEPEVAALFNFPGTGLQPSHVNDILLARAELGITGRKIQQLTVQAVAAAQPTPPDEELEGETPEPPRKVKRVQLEAAGPQQEPPDTGAVPTETEPAQPETPRKVKKLALEAVTRDEAAQPEPPAEIVVPPGIDISDTVRVGQTLHLPLALEEGEKLHAFRPTSLPGQASFDPSALAITWTPTEEQVGLHTVEYDVEFEQTGDVDVEETGQEVRVVKKTQSRTVQIHLVVLSEQTD